MDDLKIEIENLETFLNNSNNPNNDEAWYSFCQNINDKISNIKREFNYYENELDEKNKEIETLNDRLDEIKNIVS